jgi:hypothetical protein
VLSLVPRLRWSEADGRDGGVQMKHCIFCLSMEGCLLPWGGHSSRLKGRSLGRNLPCG